MSTIPSSTHASRAMQLSPGATMLDPSSATAAANCSNNVQGCPGLEQDRRGVDRLDCQRVNRDIDSGPASEPVDPCGLWPRFGQTLVSSRAFTRASAWICSSTDIRTPTRFTSVHQEVKFRYKTDSRQLLVEGRHPVEAGVGVVSDRGKQPPAARKTWASNRCSWR